MSKTTNKFSSEVRQRAVRMVLGHEAEHPSRWATVFYCGSNRLQSRTKAFEGENRELRRANAILRKVPAYFAMTEAGIQPSGDRYDNPLTEPINGLYKAELICRH